jgi:manganese efflux pump family protein
MKAYFKRFKTKYGITSNWDAFIIIVVFAITGSLSVKVAKPVLDYLGIDKETMSPWAFWPIRILIIFPVYQILQIIIGFLFGQFKFFWAFQKKMYLPFGRIFGYNPNR